MRLLRRSRPEKRRGNNSCCRLAMTRTVTLSFPVSFLLLTASLTLFSSPLYAELRNGMAADVVIGQPDFAQGTADNGGQGAATLNSPIGIFSDGKKLFASDRQNQRVLIWNSIPKSNFVPADVVVGQPDFSQDTADNGGQGASTLNAPFGVSSDGDRLFVADRNNNRVLIWNSIPTTNFAPADVVLGQPDFTQDAANNGGREANTLSSPRGVFSDGKKLFVADNNNHRILIWNTIPTSNNTPSDVVVGQPDFAQGSANNGGLGARTLNGPPSVFSDGKRLFVADSLNHRILIWNSIPSSNFAPADVVLGQPDFTTASTGTTQTRMSNPRGVFSDGKRLFVVEQTNSRVLIWNSIPTANFTPADTVLGQMDFSQGTANSGGRRASSLSTPFGISSDGNRLFVSDQNNHRILIFNIGSSAVDLSPQFTQGKAVLGKVFWDWNGNGRQDRGPVRLESSARRPIRHSEAATSVAEESRLRS